jgi:DNA-binding MarR family transcriptional regulator
LRRVAGKTDGRAVDVLLSPAGAELAERLSTHVRRSLSPMTKQLSPTDQHRLQVLLERMLGQHES